MEVHEIAGDKEAFDGQTITVSGIAEDTVKIGELSGYSLRDPITDERIAVSSDTLPREGETVRVTGVWVRDSLFGYYLKAEE